MSLSSAGEDFFTFINKLNGLACSRSKEGSAKILGIEVDLLTKSSPNFWFDHADFTFRDVEGGRQVSPEKKRNLVEDHKVTFPEGSARAKAAWGSRGQ